MKIKTWTEGVLFEDAARQQVENIAALDFVRPHVAIMPDVHFGRGATVGSVIPTVGAIIPAAVGVDIGCGMNAIRTNITASQLPDSLAALRSEIERVVPQGFNDNGGHGSKGAQRELPEDALNAWDVHALGYEAICAKHPKVAHLRGPHQIGTLGSGNHFIELCLDETQRLWLMLHSGSRGPGNRIGTYFTELAKEDMRRQQINLPDADLAYLVEGSEYFWDYIQAVGWAQQYAVANRGLMLRRVTEVLLAHFPTLSIVDEAIDCHHNYVQREGHFGQSVWLTRKGAVSAQLGEKGIIPGSMGAKSYIVRGLGNKDSFCSCSHGAGRAMSRGMAKKTFSLEDHIAATQGVECRKDMGVLDETPSAYKNIDAVMAAQRDLVEIKYTLKQVLCVKG